ncbi:outer membrane protein assembly factor BamE (lipoprotein component of BamABCDE complex) [Azoarcus indigens]|uniref:Outer membrane protein assembly factor BamE n=2 Tax=Azoarcus indigens TaxID=29545 RepID=A0A4R6EFJ6_9RHOO|nr:outer membrane protein assembly factor BamE (lipoprotein component of BamABCDE complex) [Azoarcus indigens]
MRRLPAPYLTHSMRSSLPCALIAAVLVTACSVDTIVNKVNPYKIDVRQGNYVDQAMVSQLKKGMTRDQVRFVLGSPLVVDVFRKDRWDYVYRFKPGKAEAEQRIISVYFVDDRLDHVEGDVAAGDAQGAAAAQQEHRSRVVDVPAVDSK